MALWIFLALLTAAVAACLLMPLARKRQAGVSERAGEIEVYRDQLKELERDQAQGLIGAEEAEYARAEIGRRLIAAADAGGGPAMGRPERYRFAKALVTVLPPALGLCLYLALGNPGLPDQPLEARLANPGNNVALLVAKAERHLAQNPSDGGGWDLLAPIYFRSERYADAEMAYRNAIRLLGVNAARLSGLGETLVALNDGIVTEDARASFEQAVKLEPGNPRSRFYVGLGLEQSGRADEARAVFEEIAGASPPDAPWMPLVNQHIAKNGGTTNAQPAPAPGNPSSEEVAAAQNMSQNDRQAMIRGMVEGLDAKLKQDPNNLQGWLRLVRSYAVLGDRQKAQDAINNALVQFPASGQEGQQIVALAREIGLAAEDAAPQGMKQ